MRELDIPALPRLTDGLLKRVLVRGALEACVTESALATAEERDAFIFFNKHFRASGLVCFATDAELSGEALHHKPFYFVVLNYLIEHRWKIDRELIRYAERIAVETYGVMSNWLADVDPTSSRILQRILSLEEEHLEIMLNFVAVVID